MSNERSIDGRPLPKFTYHPNPVGNGLFERKDSTCPCCGKKTGWAYFLHPYTGTDVSDLCPWCIADGSAFLKFHGGFSDRLDKLRGKVPESVIAELDERTPGYRSLQGEDWMACCGDVCEYLGEITKEELALLPPVTVDAFMRESEIDKWTWEGFLEDHEPNGNPEIYQFRCRHCGMIHLNLFYD